VVQRDPAQLGAGVGGGWRLKASWLASRGVLAFRLVNSLFQKLWTTLLCQKLWFVITKPFRGEFLLLIMLYLWTHLRVSFKEGVWIRNFLYELGVSPSVPCPLDLYCGNNGAIAQAKELRNHQKNKHLLQKFHLIWEIVKRGDIKICKVHTNLNVADPLTLYSLSTRRTWELEY
jgi:hypothetical protein